MKGIAFLSGFISVLITSGVILPASSQVNSDNTTNTTVNTSGNNFNILNGIQKGNNLFHSFKEFSIPTGGSATFQTKAAIENIINRVTGGNISNIDGLIKASGNANLFLINPNGIVFGENARLDIGGSFFATTADSIVFPDNMEFSATNTDEPPLLSINVPLGIQFGSTAATITNRSQIIDSDTTSTVGLQVKPGKSISLLGGNIEFDSGRLTASGGRVNLGAVAPDSFVSLSSGDFGWILGYERVNNFQDILLKRNNNIDDDNIYINTSGDRGGDIDIQGREILFKGAAALAITLGSEDGGKITINSSESLKIYGSLEEEIRAFLDSTTYGLGNGADIEINSPNIHIDVGSIFTSTFNQGKSGNITINTNKLINEDGLIGSISNVTGNGTITGNGGNVTITAEHISVNSGAITSDSFGGEGGDLNINVRHLELANSGVISTSVWTNQGRTNKGKAGNLIINASESISISGYENFQDSDLLFLSGLLSRSFAQGSVEDTDFGNGGIIEITTGDLKIFDGGQITTSTSGTGNAGNIFIDANRVEISESITGSFGERGGISSTVTPTASGNGGNIDIQAEDLRVFDGGSIAADTLGIAGDAGNISINAGIIDIDGVLSEQQLPSKISALSQNGASAGSVNITTDKINIRDGAEINVSNQGSGNSGNLNIAASNLFLDKNGSLKAKVNGGEKGNINLNIDESLLLRRGSLIKTNATATSEGGNITINSPVIAGFENSDIIANAVEGNGGNINITTSGVFGLELREKLTEENDITASSEFGINGTVKINNVNIDPNTGLVELPAELTDSSQQITAGCSSNTRSTFIATGRGGIPHNPSKLLNLNSTWSDIRDFSTSRKINNSSEITSISNKPIIVEATGFIRNKNGVIELVAVDNKPLKTQIPDCSGKNT